ncbi:hypothetical protein SELMODRAFT_406301 [Selaginella moellendorffii]|uniref:Uncharacterized protein n=1 Tax=Selaginella moellendorffii TaxID=88036 RepID=D8R1X8_SELML|nr:hypothetical protein SELMODRAFT_406301 [Selaginella moellendorffii]
MEIGEKSGRVEHHGMATIPPRAHSARVVSSDGDDAGSNRDRAELGEVVAAMAGTRQHWKPVDALAVDASTAQEEHSGARVLGRETVGELVLRDLGVVRVAGIAKEGVGDGDPFRPATSGVNEGDGLGPPRPAWPIALEG